MDLPDIATTGAKGIAARLTRSYAIGLGVIAALALASTLYTIRAAQHEAPEGQYVNRLGRQRTLTARIVGEGFALAARAQPGAAAGRRSPRGLDGARDTWDRSLDSLRRGDKATGLRAATPDELQSLDALATDFHAADRLIGRMLEQYRDGAPSQSLVLAADSLSVIGAQLVATLDGMTRASAEKQRKGANRIRQFALVFCALLLCVLGLEVITVFRPATRTIAALVEGQEVAKNELYAKAEEMYHASVQQEIQNDTLQTQQQTLLEQQEEMLAQQETLIEQRDHLESRTSELSRLTAILDATPDAVAVFSLTGDVLYTNSSADQHLRHVRRRNWTQAAHLLVPESVRQLRNVAFPHAVRRGVWQGEARMRSESGVTRTMTLTLLAHRGGDGRVDTISAMLQDITEQRTLLERVAEGEARNRAIVESLAEGVIVQDGDGRIISWNKSAERILGVDADQLAARAATDLWSAIDQAGEPMTGARHPIARALRDARAIDDEVMGVERGDGTRVWLSVNARPMAGRGRPTDAAVVATFTDITASLAAAQELETLSLVARQSDYAIVMLTRDGFISWVNPAWEELTGYSLDEAANRRPDELVHGPHTSADVAAQIHASLRRGERWSGEILHYRKNGSPYWVEVVLTPTIDGGAGVTGFVGLARDITLRRSAERERQQLAAAVALTADGIAITGVSGALEFVNHAFARMHGRQPADLLQTQWAALYDADEAKRLVREALPEVTQVGFWHGEATGLHQDGSTYPQELSLTLLPHGGLVAVTRDISDRKAAEERLLHLSVRDELTSLFNRRGFMEQADAVLKLSARQNVPCALLYGDLDSFKAVNDGYGHDAGDVALKTIAGILRATFRETDLIARLGGDEFTILAIDVGPGDLAMLVDRINDATARNNAARADDASQAWRLGISLGVAPFDPQSPMDVESLLRVADAAQYERKRERKARAAAQAA